MQHKQVWIKVNVQVDAMVAPLIEALSRFPELRTVESCQRNKERGVWVCFEYGGSWRSLSEFVFGRLGRRLTHEFGDKVDASLQITGTFGAVRAHLIVSYESLEAAIVTIGGVYDELYQKKEA